MKTLELVLKKKLVLKFFVNTKFPPFTFVLFIVLINTTHLANPVNSGIVIDKAGK